jgi:hypothetical protein
VAERIDNLDRSRPTLYPWRRWLDGSAWRIRRGDDFEVSAESMAAQIRMRAVRDGLRVFTRCPDCETVEFQFLLEQAA